MVLTPYVLPLFLGSPKFIVVSEQKDLAGGEEMLAVDPEEAFENGFPKQVQ